jgi:hypothetical protein
MKTTTRTYCAYVIAIAGGALLWWLAAKFGHKREAWDSPLYWQVSYPLSIVLAAALAWWVPEKPWRWGLSVLWAQAFVMLFSGSDFGLLPLGLILFGVLSLPANWLAKRVAQWKLKNRSD